MNDAFVQFLRRVLDDREFLFRFLDFFPLPVEVFAPDGTSLFLNRACMEMNNISDPDLVVGKYNLLNDPVCNDQMGMRKSIQKAFDGEAVVCPDVAVPIQDLVDRGVIDEKPFEKSFADFYLYPIKQKGELVFVVFICVVKKLYYGRPDLVRAKEYIDTHWQDKYNKEKIARSVSISVAQLYKLFKAYTGMTPGDYHKKVKVERIKEKLLDKNLSVKEAFAFCDEDSRGWMLRVFKEMTGMTPTQFRDSVHL